MERSMSALGSETELVKVALSSGTASSSTVVALQKLLSFENNTQAAKNSNIAKSKTTAKAPKTTRTAKTPVAKLQKQQSVQILADETKCLSGKEKYALATEVVNITLKALTEASRRTKVAHRNQNSHENGDTPSTPRISKKKPLQEKSGNSTPSPGSRQIGPKKSSGQSPGRKDDNEFSMTATAECARLAFASLRGANTEQLGIRQPPNLQLETGMIALVGKLIALGMESLAIRELRIIKKKLEAKQSKPTSRPASTEMERETLASLIELDIDFSSHSEKLPLAISYQALVLKVLTSAKPGVIEAVARTLLSGEENSPASLIARNAKQSKDNAKAAKQLDVLSQSILGLCPSVSTTHDSAASDATISPSPLLVFQLQMGSLKLRQSWWKLAGHKADLERELVDPFSKCLSALARRSTSTKDDEIYRTANDAYNDLLSKSQTNESESIFSSQRSLAVLAEMCGLSEESLTWTETMMSSCTDLPHTHARKVACLVRFAILKLQSASTSSADDALAKIKKALYGQTDGQYSDYSFLVGELAQFCRTIISVTPKEVTEDAQTVISLAANFAQRFARSWPGKSGAQVQMIIFTAVRTSKSTEHLLSWISIDAAKSLVSSGALSTVANAASKMPMNRARMASSSTVALDRILRALVLKSMKSNGGKLSSSILDDETLPPTDRAVLLEWQLICALEYAPRQKYHAPLQQILSELFGRLSQLYKKEEHPIRRARVYILALQLQQNHPGLLSLNDLMTWQDTRIPETNELKSDIGLKEFRDDISAMLQTAKLFDNGRPTPADLRPALLLWHDVIESCTSTEDLEQKIDNCSGCISQLRAVATYFSMMGEDAAALPVQNLLSTMGHTSNQSFDMNCNSSIDVALRYLNLEFSEKAGHALAQTDGLAAISDSSKITRLRRFVAYANYYVAIDNLEKAEAVLNEARELRAQISLEEVQKPDRRTFEVLHGHGWLVQSKVLLGIGHRHDALVAAKRSVKILNSIWSALERSEGKEEPKTETIPSGKNESDVNSLATGISKLKLSPIGSASPTTEKAKSENGAAFWALIPLMYAALTNLSQTYAHHGLFAEADYYAVRAVETAESVGASKLISKAKIHRSRILALAGKLEDAELCLESSRDADLDDVSLFTIDLCEANASIRTKEGELKDAEAIYEHIDSMIDKMNCQEYLETLESLRPGKKAASNSKSTAADENEVCETKPKATRRPASKAATSRSVVKTSRTMKTPAARATKGAKSSKASEAVSNTAVAISYLLSKRKANVLMEKAIIALRLENDVEAALVTIEQLCSGVAATLSQRRLIARSLVQKAVVAMQADFSFNILPESTLSFPALQRADRRPSEQGHRRSSLPLPTQTVVAKKPKTAKSRSRIENAANEVFSDLLVAARESLVSGHAGMMKLSSTSDIHLECSMLSDITMLLSVTGLQQVKGALHPIRQALHLDAPRIQAMQCEIGAAAAEIERSEQSSPLAWPLKGETEPPEIVNASDFQEEYVDILPSAWTVVSLCLTEDNSELYATRYRSGQSPFILRLPFARHKPESIDEDDDAFDYAKGKAELEEIIEISNYSCHNSGGMDSKAAKKNWWSEREALDKRLQELLLNIQNIWLGGFRGMFSLHTRQIDLLARFRKSFDDILGRYLPSRQATKGKSKPLVVDSKVLELFIGLGDDQDGVIDIDEPLADLLYFVVDMLQFNGEQNAYDEIDFDSMIVDVADALRVYHEACDETNNEDQHLILVLDKRLQAFPWESMPCLEGMSVSRVGSLLTIKERLDEIRNETPGTDHQTVSRKSGTYILNPSSDLSGTQEVLSPSLTKLAEAHVKTWTSIVNTAPTEDEFSSALGTSSMLLYFGHGAGSQYIRPRTIKRLDRCSKVVWLMGCSSGAVTEYGELEPFAVPLSYLLAGHNESVDDSRMHQQSQKCMAVVATLWDVTDKDIDRFSLAVGEEWGLFEESEASKLPAKPPKKRERMLTVSTPPQPTKTPKTPRVNKTPAPPAKTPSRSRSQGRRNTQEKKPRSLVEAVARSRDACYLRYLNGAAPVVYGVPVYLVD